jgi:2,3-bisphosphoglycerate-independent phosphoglycerate mutase
MKRIYVILDGVADKKSRQLDMRTPLEAADKPNLDFFTFNGKMGHMFVLNEGIAPESDSAITAILGYKPFVESRGVIEALGEGINFSRGDLILRANFATLDNWENREILDRRAGRSLTSKDLEELEKVINENVRLPFEFKFYSTGQHRGILIVKGGFSDNISNTDPDYNFGKAKYSGSKLLMSKSLDGEDESSLSANLINNFTKQVFNVLDNHEINLDRKKKGLMPANVVILRDSGNERPKFSKLKGKWIGFAYTPLMKGIVKSVGMKLKTFDRPKMKDMDYYAYNENLLKIACKNAKKMIARNFKKYNNFFVHFMETDIPGHDNKPLEKVKMIEMIDKMFFSWLRKYKDKVEVIVTPDHVTACSLKKHTGDPVPVMIYGKKNSEGEFDRDDVESFDEERALFGGLGKIDSKDFMGLTQS